MEEAATRPRIPADVLSRIKSFFIKYASAFRKDDPVYNQHILLKQNHTAGVVREISQLSAALGLNPEETAFAEVIAWLHDIGRFEQFDTYATFADAESENHAEIALRIIEKNNLLLEFSASQIQIIERTIVNHNLKKLPDREPELVGFYSRLLRDADKLDIWRVMLKTNIFHTIKNELLPNFYPIPKKLLSYFEMHQIIPLDEVDTFYDSILFRLSWVFDLNFKATIEQFEDRDLTRKFLSKLPLSKELSDIEKWIGLYIENYIQK